LRQRGSVRAITSDAQGELGVVILALNDQFGDADHAQHRRALSTAHEAALMRDYREADRQRVEGRAARGEIGSIQHDVRDSERAAKLRMGQHGKKSYLLSRWDAAPPHDALQPLYESLALPRRSSVEEDQYGLRIRCEDVERHSIPIRENLVDTIRTDVNVSVFGEPEVRPRSRRGFRRSLVANAESWEQESFSR